jgi:hypothetical protein
MVSVAVAHKSPEIRSGCGTAPFDLGITKFEIRAIRYSETEWGAARKTQYMMAIREKFSLLLHRPTIGAPRQHPAIAAILWAGLSYSTESKKNAWSSCACCTSVWTFGCISER